MIGKKLWKQLEEVYEKKAAKKFKAFWTLIGKMLGQNSGPVGNPTVLKHYLTNLSNEAALVETLDVVANWGFSLTRVDIQNVDLNHKSWFELHSTYTDSKIYIFTKNTYILWWLLCERSPH